jgi:hypothetical protein
MMINRRRRRRSRSYTRAVINAHITRTIQNDKVTVNQFKIKGKWHPKIARERLRERERNLQG